MVIILRPGRSCFNDYYNLCKTVFSRTMFAAKILKYIFTNSFARLQSPSVKKNIFKNGCFIKIFVYPGRKLIDYIFSGYRNKSVVGRFFEV